MSTASDVAQRFKNSNIQSVLDENLSGLLVLPGLLLWAMFMVIPMSYVALLSLTNAKPANLFGHGKLLGLVPIGQVDFVGLENYVRLLFSHQAANDLLGLNFVGFFNILVHNPLGIFAQQFWNSFLVTWLFVIVSVTGKVLLGVAIAMIMTGNRVRGKRYLRGLIIMPMGIPVIFSITVWKTVFSSADFGLLNQFITWLGLPAQAWLTQRWPAFFSYVVTEMWLAYPFMVLITVSALQNVNGDLLDAAEVDGAGFFSRLRHVILPSIRRPVMFGTILTSAASFQQFLIPFVFNQGGPGHKNEFLLLYAYKQAFTGGKSLYGKGAAISLTAIFFIGIFMLIAVRRGNLAEEAGE